MTLHSFLWINCDWLQERSGAPGSIQQNRIIMKIVILSKRKKKNTAKEEDREKESIKYIIRVYCVCAI